MESGGVRGRLVGTEIHGFHTLHDLDLPNIIEEAKMRWLRPNEIHAILCNFKYFNISVKPVNLPKSGTIVLFDRKMLRNFRKDGHNWKKKKDGKTVKEAHEHLKVGNEERIHVYYAHGQDNPTFVRRCYWLLDKTLEHIVLVHYRETQENRETQELQGSPATPVNSSSSSVSDPSAPWLLSEELDSGADQAYRVGVIDLLEPGDSLTVRNHEMTLHDINTLEWDELLVTNDPNNSTSQKGDKVSFIDQQNQVALNGSSRDSSNLSVSNLSAEISAFGNLSEPNVRSDNINFSIRDSAGVQTMGGQVNSNVQRRDSMALGAGDSLELLVNDGLQSQDSFGRWINYILTDSPSSVDDPVHESSFSPGHDSFASTKMDHRQYVPEHIFTITDVSPSWASSTERTKILVTGFFREEYLHLAKSNLFCVCGAVCVPAEIVQFGVYRCFLSLHSPGFMNIYMSCDGHKPISQVLNFECRAPLLHDPIVSSEDKSKWEEFDVQMRLAHLLFSSSKSLSILSSKVSPNVLKEAKKFSLKTSHISNSWAFLIKSIDENKTSFQQAKDGLFELTLKNRLKEWLLERIVEGGKAKEYDVQGQGVIHLCVILGYTWAVQLFSWSGLSLDFRDKRGWTPLHWAAYCGSEKMVAVLLSAGAKPNMVTDPTSQNPGGCTPADLASMKGFEGLAAYLSEKALVDHFKDMSIAGNASGSLQTSITDTVNPENLSEKEVYTKESLQAVRTAADAAARIQAAFREHSLKVKTIAAKIFSPEEEARNIVAAMRIQHAFRNFETRKKMSAAAQIQYRFRSWKMRRQFINMRRQAIKIQAAFRGYQVRRQYRKILWSVGVLEKVILRWRLRRKGFRGLNVDPLQEVSDPKQESDAEEEFFRASQKQAVERIDRSYGQVKVMFSSMKAQEEYHRIKLAHDEARLEFQGLRDPDTEMGK